MKHSVIPFLCILCAASLLSCKKETEAPEGFVDAVFTASFDKSSQEFYSEDGSKTYRDGTHTLWSASDQIKIFYSNDSSSTFTLQSGTGTASGQFAGLSPAGKTANYAVYPAGATATRSSNTVVNVTVPEIQYGTFASCNYAVSCIHSGNELYFSNIAAMLCIQASDAARTIVVESVSGADLRGTLPVTCSSGTVSVGAAISTGSSITVSTSGSGKKYIAVLGGVRHAKGLKFTFKNSSGVTTGTYYLDKDFTPAKDKVYNFGNFEPTKAYYVTVSGAGNGNGLSWTNAMSKDTMFGMLSRSAAGSDSAKEAALFDAINGATFYMGDGTYNFGSTPLIDIDEESTITFKLEGGYNASTGARDLASNATIITGNRDDLADPVTGHICLKLRNNMDVTLDGLHFENGLSSSDKGGALNCYGTDLNVTLVDCVISNNKNIVNGADKNGAGLYLETVGSCTATRVTFSNNSSLHAPALYVYSSDITLNNCTFSGNYASSWGGIARIRQGEPVCIFNNCTFDGNSAEYDSGGVYADAGTTTFNNCNFIGNHGSDKGGALTLAGTSTVNISGGSFKGNYVNVEGGAIRISGGTPTLNIENCTFGGNQAGEPNYCGRDGGAISLKRGTTTITNCNFIGNYAYYDTCERTDTDVAFDEVTNVGYGGAIDCFDTASLTVSGGTFSGNVAWRGGAMNINTSGSVSVTGATFTANGTAEATRAGGAIFGKQNFTINNCTFGGANAADGNKAKFGGAINHVKHKLEDGTVVHGLMTVNGGTFRNNVANNCGGAICEESGAVIDRYSGQGTLFQDNWVTDDSSPNECGGGAVWAETYSGSDNKRVDVNYAVFKGNEAFSGGACYVYGDNSKICLNYCTFGGANSGDANYARGNSSNGGGGTLFMRDHNTYAELVECTITGDHAKRYGGSVFANTKKDFVASGCTFTGCYSSSGWGGAIVTRNGSMNETVIKGGSFINCHSNCGGAILCRMSAGKLVFTDYNGEGTLFQGNYADTANSTLEGGAIELQGGATVNDGVSSLRVTIWKSRFVGNYAGKGGAIYASSAGKPDIYIDRCSFDGNYITRKWGPVLSTDGLNRFQMNNCTIRNSYTTSTSAGDQTGLGPSWIALDGMPDDGLVTISNTTIIGDVQYSSDGSSFTPLPSGNALVAIWGNQPNYLINNIIVPNTASVTAVMGTGSEDVKLRYNQLSTVSNVSQDNLGGNVTGRTASSIGGLSWTNNCWQWNGTIGGNAPAKTTASDVLDRLNALNAAFITWIDSPDDHYDYYGTNRGNGSWWPGAYQPAVN